MITRSAIEKYRVQNLSITGSLLCNAAKKLGMQYRILPHRFIEVSKGRKQFFFRGNEVPSYDAVASVFADDKYTARFLLQREKVPVPKTVLLDSPTQWRKIRRARLSFPLAVKPMIAAHGSGATMNIKTWKELHKGVECAFDYLMKRKDIKACVLVEEFFKGNDLRLLVVGKRVVSVLHREPASVRGDGRLTIRGLIQAYNRKWTSDIDKYDLPLCPIPFDHEVYRCLRSQHLRLSSILPKGKKIFVRWNANVSTGGQTIAITDEVHPRIKKIAVRAANRIHVPVAGVDLLVKDWTSDDCTKRNIVLLEVNSAPGFDIHTFPCKGPARNVAEDILRLTFRLKPVD